VPFSLLHHKKDRPEKKQHKRMFFGAFFYSPQSGLIVNFDSHSGNFRLMPLIFSVSYMPESLA